MLRRLLVAAALVVFFVATLGAARPLSAQGSTLFAGVASAPGVNGTEWRSEVVLANPGATAASVRLDLVPRGETGVVASQSLVLGAGETRRIPDIYTALGAASGAGTLRVTGSVLAWVRTFNQGTGGTFGMDVPPVTPVSPGVPLLFPIEVPADPATQFRSNLLLINLETTTTTFMLVSGTTAKTYDVPGGVFAQISGLGQWMGLPAGPTMLTITATGRWSGLVSTIDPACGDPTTVRGLTASTRSVTQFCGVASAPGVNGTAWRSEASIYNPRATPLFVTLELVPRGESVVAARTTLSLAPFQLQRIADVYTALGSGSGAGILRVTGDVMTWVRTFNQGAGETFGMDVPESVPGTGFGPGAPVSYPVTTPADVSRDFRSNLLVYNHEARTVTLTLAAGAASRTLDVPAGMFIQANNVGAWLGLPAGVATVSISGTGRWSGIVSTIDPLCGDPTTVIGIGTTPNPLPTARGAAAGSAVTATIGASGGSLASADGRLALSVPAGALSSATALTIQPVTNLSWGGVGAAYRLGPDGTAFVKPVTLTFSLSDADLLAASLRGFSVCTQDSDGYWSWLPGVVRDDGRKSLSVPTTHLSDYSALQGLQLKPLSASIGESQSQSLSIQDCCEGCLDDPADPLAPLTKTFPCSGISSYDPTRGLIFTENWSVNGTPGGNSTVGTILNEAGALESTYSAPSKAPNPPTVGASVEVSYRSSGKVALVSEITVGKPQSLSGTFSIDSTSVLGYTVRVEADATLTLYDDGPDETNYTLSGASAMKTKSLSYGEATCTLNGDGVQAIPKAPTLFKVRKEPQLAVRWTYLSDTWNFSCTESGVPPYSMGIVIHFATATGLGCGTPFDVPIDDANSPAGTFTQTCLPVQINVAEWRFHP